MAARANSLLDLAPQTQPLARDERFEPQSSIARLALLHAEAEDTARLANLLGRTLYAALALPLAGAVVIALSANAGTPSRLAWAVLLVVCSLAIARTYGATIGRPFERTALRNFAQELCAVMLYAGFAWGTGAFLVLPASAPFGAALIFAAAPALGLALLLRERNEVLVFLAPVTALTSFACVLRPFAAGAMNAALVLIASALVGGALIVRDRRRADARARAMPASMLGA